jgi:quercetin dioxygenase-like cupin family protein
LKIIKSAEKEWTELEGYSKKIIIDEKLLRTKGCVVQIVRSKAHTEIKSHYHKHTIEVFCILKGNILLLFDDKKFRTKEGDFFLCEPGDKHGVINDTDKDSSILVYKINSKENDRYRV